MKLRNKLEFSHGVKPYCGLGWRRPLHPASKTCTVAKEKCRRIGIFQIDFCLKMAGKSTPGKRQNNRSHNSAFSRAAQSALKEVFGRAPVLVREGLSIPIVSLFQLILKKESLLIGLGLPDCNAHAPNETFPLAQLENGTRLHQVLLERFSET